MCKCCNLLTIFITRQGGANVNHSTNPSTRKANLANFFLLWTQPCVAPEINRDWLPLSVADERWQTSWGGKMQTKSTLRNRRACSELQFQSASIGGQETIGLLVLEANSRQTLFSLSILPTGGSHKEFLKKSGKKPQF